MSGRGDYRGVQPTEYIVARSLHDFVSKLSSRQRIEFYRTIKHPRIFVDRVHPIYEYEVEKKSFLGKFHQYFVEKVITNCKNEDWQSSSLREFATIFPFKVCKDVEESELDIFRFLSAEFEDDVKKFIKNHFNKVDDVRNIIRLFLRNINHFKGPRPIGDSLEYSLHEMKIGASTDQRKSIPKLTEKGVERYLFLYKLTEEAMKSLSSSQAEEISFSNYDESYFLNLPETNTNDLYSLLDSDYFQSNPEEYKKRFEKYIFFFLYALQNEQPNPVFFIDDLLFVCLKSLHIWETSRDNPINLKSHISNLVCVYQRKRYTNYDNSFMVSDKSLEEIKKFFETGISQINTAVIHYSVEDAPLNYSRIFAATNQEAFELCFSKNIKNQCYHFINIIIAAASSSINFEKLCIYNAYLGTKAWMFNPPCKKEVIQFVEKYCRPDTTDVPPEHFLIKDFKECYEL